MDPESVECELARRARDGDREALAQLVEQERPALFTLAYAHLRHHEDAQDVLASALLQICRHIEELREPRRVRAWMQMVLRNEARQCLRRPVLGLAAVQVEELTGRSAGDLTAGMSSSDPASSLVRLDIRRALRRLPWGEARAVSLFYLGGLPIRDIARHMGRPEGTIKRWLHLGRQHLATELDGYGPRNPKGQPLT
jgi:RNA polymerase sigma-70 factor (ECF subfamily)